MDGCCIMIKTSDGTAVLAVGQGSPVVLIHGVGLDQSIWSDQRNVLSKDHTVITYDIYGHGDSALSKQLVTLDVFSEQLLGVLDHFELERADIVGFSIGSLIAETFCLAHPDRVDRMGVLNGVFDRSPEEGAGVRQRLEVAKSEGPSAIINAAVERWFSPEFQEARPDVISAVRKRLESNDPEGFLPAYGIFAHIDDQIAERIGEIKADVLVMTGTLDTGSTPAMAYRLAERLDNARVEILEGGRHMMPVENADYVSAVLSDFLAR